MKIVTMGEATSDFSTPAAVFQFAVQRWEKRVARLFHPYQPSRHYMRGPGPKWREKHGLTEE
ncbi:MAG TPA: hypothetical protein VM639_13885 [Dongiaceae bacterium]|nr:hypothetical protein [Dongiaceae bacterium]